MKLGKLLAAVVVIFSLSLGSAACDMPAATRGAAVQPDLQDKDIVVLYTNDVHCAVDENIGYAGLAAYKKAMEELAHVALLDVGDAIQGGPIGTFSTGKSIIELMNHVGYDVAIPGNHEYDYGMEHFLKLTGEAEFPYVSANFTNLATGELVFAPYVIKTFGARKIAFVGVTTPQTITSSTPANFQDENGDYIYDFERGEDGQRLYSAVQAAVDSARAEGADYVILLAHLGIAANSSPYTSTELIYHTTGIDAVLDGHSHSVIDGDRVRNAQGDWTLLTSTGTELTAIGMLLITKEGNLTTDLIDDYTEKDADTQALVDELKGELNETLQMVVGSTEFPLVINDPATGQRIVRNAETNLGDLCADACRSVTGSEVALVNAGCVRADIAAGAMTYEDIMKVHPFGNAICQVEATGSEILDALEMGARAWPEESGGFLHVSGLQYEIDVSIPSGVKLDEDGMFIAVDGEYRVRKVMVGDEPLELTRTYTLAGNDFILQKKGNGYTMFVDNTVLQDSIMPDYQALITYITQTLGGVIGEEYADPYGTGRISELTGENH